MSFTVECASVGKEAADALSALHHESFTDAPWSGKAIAGLLTLKTSRNVTVSVENELAGFAIATNTGEEIELLTIAIAPRFRGRSLAGTLLAELDREAFREDATRWLLEVAEDNVSALKLYEKCGFRPFSRRKDYYKRQGAISADALMMDAKVGAIHRE